MSLSKNYGTKNQKIHKIQKDTKRKKSKKGMIFLKMEQMNNIKFVTNWKSIKLFSGTVFAIYSSNNGKKIETKVLTTKQNY